MEPTVTSTRHTVVLEVAGQRLRLAANAEPSHLERLAAVVNEQAESVLKSAKSTNSSTLLALVALDLADELLTARRRLEEAQAEAKKSVAAAEARARDVEQLARRAVAEAIAEIDRALLQDDTIAAKEASASETA